MTILSVILIFVSVILLILCGYFYNCYRVYRNKYRHWKSEYKELNERFKMLWYQEQLKDSPYPECAYCLKFQAPVSGDVYLLRHTNGICQETGEPTKGSNVCEYFTHDPLPIS